jgi:hypothetical protein
VGTPGTTIGLKRYGRLLAKTAPRVIATEHGRAIAMVESPMEKGGRNMTPEDDALLDLLTNPIRDYEAIKPRFRGEVRDAVPRAG